MLRFLCLLLSLLNAAAGTYYADKAVNDLFDKSLAQMENNLREQNGGFVKVERHLFAEGYQLEGAEFGDLTTLKRHGNVTILSRGDIVKIQGYIEIPNMIIRGGNITSLSVTILNPKITFYGFDGFLCNFLYYINEKICRNVYSFERKYWTRGRVILESDTEGFKNKDITDYIEMYEEELTIPLQNALAKTFGDFFGFCETIVHMIF